MVKLELKNNEAEALCKLIEGFRSISINSCFALDDIDTYFWMEDILKKIREGIESGRS